MFPWLNFGRSQPFVVNLPDFRWKETAPDEMTLSEEQIQLAFKRLSGGKARVRLGHGFFGIFQPALAQDFGETTSTQVFVDVFWRFEDAKGTAGICWA